MQDGIESRPLVELAEVTLPLLQKGRGLGWTWVQYLQLGG